MNTAELYESYKPLLFSIAYRLLGSVADAEDIVQETFLSWTEREDHLPVTNVRAYLCRIVSNLCTDRIRRQSKQRETYVGPWLPDPLVDDGRGPEDVCLRKDTIHTAYLLLLQQLSEVERIVFVLREAFGFDYKEIAEITGKNAVHCRQIFHRAKRGLPIQSEEKRPAPAQTEQAHHIIQQFMHSFEHGNISRVMELLAADVTLIMDGGGKAKAALNPIQTSQRVLAFFSGTAKKLPPGISFRIATVNGLPGLIFSLDQTVLYVLSLAFEGQQISRIYMTVNPDKLKHLHASDK